METKNEFILLLNDEPLTLACSAIADFLWDDFIRDARPSVKYLVERYNIRQLSRFGKEVFDRLYTADNVTWLVSFDEYEEYYRKVYDGETASLPAGYKPENGFWWAIMSDLSEAAAWPDLLMRCTGDQFNAGNNAISILNKLSELIEQALNETNIDIQIVVHGGESLEKLREQFKQAKAQGNEKEAQKARAQGKAKIQEINEEIQQLKDLVQPHLSSIVDKTIKESDETNEQITNLWGNEKGVGRDCGNLQEKKALASRLKNNRELKKLASKLGVLRKVWLERKRARKHQDQYAAIAGARFSNDLTKAFSTELALAGTDKGRALFALKYTQKTILTKDYEANRKDIGKGPIVMYIDVSGSMRGEQEIWSKAVAFMIAEEGLKEKREVQINLFDTEVTETVTLVKDRKDNRDLLDFVGRWSLGGGTAFNSVIRHAGKNGELRDRADVLMITDGHSDVSDPEIRRLDALKAETGLQWSTVCLNTSVPKVCFRFSDEVYSVDTSKQADAIDVVQKCFR